MSASKEQRGSAPGGGGYFEEAVVGVPGVYSALSSQVPGKGGEKAKFRVDACVAIKGPQVVFLKNLRAPEQVPQHLEEEGFPSQSKSRINCPCQSAREARAWSRRLHLLVTANPPLPSCGLTFLSLSSLICETEQ